VVHYLFVAEHKVQNALEALFINHIGVAPSDDYFISILVVVVEYPGVIHGEVGSVFGLNG